MTTQKKQHGPVERVIRMVLVGSLALFVFVLTVSAIQEDRERTGGAATPPPPVKPLPTPDPAALVAEVDRLADAARAAKGAGPALDGWDAADKALAAAEVAGAPASDVAPRRAAIAKELAAAECAYQGERRAGPVRRTLLTQMANAGMNGNVTVSGKCGDAVVIEWALWTDVTVHEFQSGAAWQALVVAGFRKIVLKSWDGTTWTWEPV